MQTTIQLILELHDVNSVCASSVAQIELRIWVADLNAKEDNATHLRPYGYTI